MTIGRRSCNSVSVLLLPPLHFRLRNCPVGTVASNRKFRDLKEEDKASEPWCPFVEQIPVFEQIFYSRRTQDTSSQHTHPVTSHLSLTRSFDSIRLTDAVSNQIHRIARSCSSLCHDGDEQHHHPPWWLASLLLFLLLFSSVGLK
jgi:hypothetical protein